VRQLLEKVHPYRSLSLNLVFSGPRCRSRSLIQPEQVRLDQLNNIYKVASWSAIISGRGHPLDDAWKININYVRARVCLSRITRGFRIAESRNVYLRREIISERTFAEWRSTFSASCGLCFQHVHTGGSATTCRLSPIPASFWFPRFIEILGIRCRGTPSCGYSFCFPVLRDPYRDLFTAFTYAGRLERIENRQFHSRWSPDPRTHRRYCIIDCWRSREYCRCFWKS